MADRLDTPTERKFKFFSAAVPPGDGFGQFAEATARFMGSPKFILYMTIFRRLVDCRECPSLQGLREVCLGSLPLYLAEPRLLNPGFIFGTSDPSCTESPR